MTHANPKLLRLLARRGVIPGELARKGESELQSRSDVSAVEWLGQQGLFSEDQLAREIAALFRLPYVDLPTFSLDPSVTALLKEESATRHRVVPLRLQEGSISVALADPADSEARRAVEFATGRTARVEVATPTAIRDALRHAYQLEKALDDYLQRVTDAGDIPVAELTDDDADLQTLVRGSELPPIVKLFNLIVLEGLRTGASDIHVETDQSVVRVRYRVDGILEEAFRLPKWLQDPLVARCKVLSRLDITERRVPQDGRLRMRYHERMIDLRVSSLPTQFGEALTVRILDPSGTPNGLDWLGLAPHELASVRRAIARPEGIILVTGPTGSGKTTTLYSMIAERVSPTTNIVTIENPIEYQMRGVNQVEVNEKQGLTFAGTLRSILRQDPDVILVGEIRDRETAEIAIRAAQTGHLVLSTLHTNDAVSTVARLLDLGIEPYLLASSLNLVMTQRLVRCVCEDCAEAATPDPDGLERLWIPAGETRFRRGRGCPKCHKSGYRGRRGVYEVLPITQQLKKLIETRAGDGTMRLQARADGMVPLAEHAADLVAAGATTVDEVLRVVDVADDGSRCASCRAHIDESFALCPHCGTSLRVSCKGCGQRLQKEWKNCPFCGATHELAAVAPAPPGDAMAPSRAAKPPAAAPRVLKALVVDDQADMRRLIGFTIEHCGLPVEVISATDGAEALDMAETVSPDVIVLDVMMPEMDGFEVCERLRANVRTAFIPILMLTALDDPDNRTHGFLAGTDDYIGKPFARSEFVARLRRLLQRTYGVELGAAEPARDPDARHWPAQQAAYG